jgi:hypothetical protein
LVFGGGGGGGGGDGDDAVVVGGGGSGAGTFVVGGGFRGVGFARARALGSGVAVLATGVTGADVATDGTTAGTTVAGPCVEAGLWCGFGAAGARTTLRPGPGPTAIPTGAAGFASKRGISAPPAIATASRSAAITRSVRLMLFPSPADNIPWRDYRQEGCLA